MAQRTVLITGGARGIGAAIVARYAAEGWRVLSPTRADVDLDDLDAVRGFSASVGVVDALVLNAGINDPAPVASLALDVWQRTARVNVEAALVLVQALAPGMASRGQGWIVGVGSIYGQLARPGRAAYSASKAALAALMRSATVEWGPEGVLANTVAPGFVDTALTRKNNTPEQVAALAAQVPLRRLAAPGEIAGVVFMLGSEQNSYIAGAEIVVDGGFSVQ